MIEKEEKNYATDPVLTALLDRLLNHIQMPEKERDGLSIGRSSLALLYGVYGKAFEKEKFLNQSITYVEEVIENLVAGKSTLSSFNFYNGLTGFLAVLHYFNEQQILEVDLDVFASFEEEIFQWSLQQAEAKNIDFFEGFNGAFHYFQCRLSAQDQGDKTRIQGYLTEMLNSVEQLFADHSTERFHYIINHHYNRLDDRYVNEVNYGIAHGIGSTLLILMSLYQQGFQRSICELLIRRSVLTILQLDKKFEPIFPNLFVTGLDTDTHTPLYQPRLGWCYSDLNILQILHQATTLLPDLVDPSYLEQKIEQVAKRKNYAETYLDDPFLCHGFAGVAQYYLRLHQSSQHPTYDKLASYWMQRAVDFYNSHDDAYFFSESFMKHKHPASLFYGNLGVALCIISQLKPAFANWSKLILI